MLHIGRNILSLIFSRVLAGLILFLIYTRLAQYLGPEVAGQYGLLGGFLMVFSMFVDLGMSQLVIKKVSENKNDALKFLSNYFLIQLALAFVFMLVMDLFVFFAHYPQEVKNALYIAGLGLFLSSLSLPFRSIINAFQKLTIIAKVNFLNSAINAIFMILVITLNQGLFFLAFISVAVSTFDVLVYGYLTHTRFVRFKFEFDKLFIRQLFIWTWPFMLLTFFSIYNRIDTLMLPHLRDFKETGYYAAAYKFWDVLAFLPAVIGISLYPFYAERLSVGAVSDVKKGLETYTRYMIALALPLFAGAFLLSSEIALAFYGPDFLPAAPAIWILIAAISVLLVYSPANSLVISQKTRAATKVTGFTLLFNFGFNLLLIPKYGFVAAAATTLASEIIQASCYAFIIKKGIVNYRFFRSFLKPIVASALMSAVVVWLKQDFSLWLIIGAGALVYGVALLLLRFFQREDWELLSAALNIKKKLDIDQPLT
ncbi:MAG: flippase [Candidatus Doudnabacteria bacterium]|nr:flippase [Candidatus Doudnabacteria bacterium]